MNEALVMSGLRVGTVVAMLGGIGVFVLSRGWYERHPSTLPTDVNARNYTDAPNVSLFGNPSGTVVWALTFLATIIFVAAGLPKLGDPTFMAAQFEGWGYPNWLRQSVGGLEFLGAIFLLIPRTAFWAACVLGAVMAGSIATHIAAGQFGMALVPLAMLGLLSFIAAVRSPDAYFLNHRA